MKQWSSAPSRISLAPPPTEAEIEKAHDKWADPAMPENFQLLLPHTQQLLRIARSGRYGTKRKTAPDAEPDADDFNARDEEALPDDILAKPTQTEEKGFVARKWRQVPEAALVPEHLHWEFLAKRRKGLSNFYHGGGTEISSGGMPQIAKRKTRVQRVLDPATGESVIYEVLALEGQVLENELPADSQMQAVRLEPGTTVEGLGTADDEGLISLVPANPAAASRRNRPPPKKKGGPGRGKKRVTFTNPDGSTYTTIVPNATKIVPQPGQTVKHVAKGEDAGRDVSMEEAARLAHENGGEVGEGDDEGDDDDEGDEGDEDDDREDGEIPDDDAEVATTPAKKASAEPKTVAPEAVPVSTEPVEAPPAPMDLTQPSQTTHDSAPATVPHADTDIEMEDRPSEAQPPQPEVEDELLEKSVPEEAIAKEPSQPAEGPLPVPEPESMEGITESGPAPESESASKEDEPEESVKKESPVDEPLSHDTTQDVPLSEKPAPEGLAQHEPTAPEPAEPEPAAPEPAERPAVEAVAPQAEETTPEPKVEQPASIDAEQESESVEQPAVAEAAVSEDVAQSGLQDNEKQAEETEAASEETEKKQTGAEEKPKEGDEDLLGSLERSLEG